MLCHWSCLLSDSLALFLFVTTFLSSRFLTTLLLLCLSLLLPLVSSLLFPCSRYPVLHTSRMGSPSPIVYGNWSLVFRSVNNSYYPETALSPVLIKWYNNAGIARIKPGVLAGVLARELTGVLAFSTGRSIGNQHRRGSVGGRLRLHPLR